MSGQNFIPKFAFKFFLILIVIIVFYYGAIIISAWITYYNPQNIEKIAYFENPDTLNVDTTFSSIIWNIGYAGLGENMDFFYDNGKQVRDSKENVLYNLKAINNLIYKWHDTVDFFLLQEVDLGSKRSYYINESDELCNRINDCIKSFAINYHVSFVPVPVFEPMGRVKSGLFTISGKIPYQATRYGFNKNYTFPKKLFMLNRCFMANHLYLQNGKYLVLVNIHNSAFDDGELRKEQITVIKDFMISEYEQGNYVIAGGDWNQEPPSYSNNFTSYKPDPRSKSVSDSLLPDDWKWCYDSTTPTNRGLNKPLSEETLTRLIDFYVVSPNIDVLTIQCIDLYFTHSDHNPVYLKFRIKS